LGSLDKEAVELGCMVAGGFDWAVADELRMAFTFACVAELAG